MWPTSDDFKAALRRSHRRVTRIEVLRNNSTQAVIRATGGEVTVDAEADIRRRATIPLVDATGALVAQSASDLLYPAGNELRVWRGVDFGDDRPGIPDGIAPTGTELVPLITGPLYENDADDQPSGIKLSLDVYDRARWIRDNRWEDPFVIAAGSNWAQAIGLALLDRLPDTILVHLDGIGATTLTAPAVATTAGADTDPLADLHKWATAIGMELGFDPIGNPFLRDVPDLSDDVTATYAEGQGGGLLSVKKRVSREDLYNIVVASGEGTGNTAPVRAIVRDEDPDSPTYWRNGPKQRFYSSPLLKTTAQCQRAATGLLRKKLGAGEKLTLDVRMNPAHDAGDVIRVKRARSGIEARYILDAFPIPLVGSRAECAARRRGGG